MKKTIQFSKFFVPAAVISIVLVIFGVFGYFFNNGFALGVDFQAGLIQEVKIAPAAFTLRWNGVETATLTHDRNNIYIIISGRGIESVTHTFTLGEHSSIGSLTRAMSQQLPNLDISLAVSDSTPFNDIVISIQNDQVLSSSRSFIVQYLNSQNAPIDISEVRAAMSGVTQSISVQSIGAAADRHFMVRVEDKDEGRVTSAEIIQELETHFDSGSIAVIRSDYVGSRFSKNLTDQAGILISLTLLLILAYSAVRFKLQYAVGAVVAIMYDVIVIVAFVVWTRMEFTTLTIAAILTILGYSTNNTIIFFDRVRENLRLYPDNTFVDILNISLTGILGRTIITTATTMLAVLALFIFTTGSMKDFALALLVGMLSGVFTTLFIVSGFVNFWQNNKIKREKKKALIK